MIGSATKSECTNVDKGLIEHIDSIHLSERLRKEREEFFKRQVEVTSDRAVLAMEWRRETEGDVLDVRWARLVQKLAERLPIVIFKGQLVVGSQSKLFRGADPWVEYEGSSLLGTMEKDKHSIRQSAARVLRCSDEEDWEALAEAVNFFAGKSPTDVIFNNMESLYGDWYEELEKARGILRQGRNGVSSPVPMWEKLLTKGLRVIIREAEAGIERVRNIEKDRSGGEPEVKKAWFWQAVIICCQAVIHYAHRYARLARELAEGERDPARRRELEQVAESCERVPEYPAHTLHEAVQSRIIWGIAMMWCKPQVVPDRSGRSDQYFYPYFMSDIRERHITPEEASELIGAFLSNVARRDGVMNVLRGQYYQGTLISNVTLGGLDKEGQDAANELTYLILHMAGLLRYAEPHYTLRVNAATPRWALMKALETNRKVGGGQPQFMSDDRNISYLMKQGEDLEAARDWMAVG